MTAGTLCPSVHGLRWEPLQPAHLDAMHALHLCSMAGLDAHAVKPESRGFFAGLLRGQGRVLGAWHGPTLVAYGVLQHALSDDDQPQALLGLPPGQAVLKLAGAAVAPDWRGQRLQRQLVERRLAWAGRLPVFATAAPCNPASWRNLLAGGLSVRGLQYRYGGLARYLLARVPDAPPFVADPVRAQELGPHELAAQQALLQQGWRGLRPGTCAPDHLCLQPAAPPTGQAT